MVILSKFSSFKLNDFLSQLAILSGTLFFSLYAILLVFIYFLVLFIRCLFSYMIAARGTRTIVTGTRYDSLHNIFPFSFKNQSFEFSKWRRRGKLEKEEVEYYADCFSKCCDSLSTAVSFCVHHFRGWWLPLLHFHELWMLFSCFQQLKWKLQKTQTYTHPHTQSKSL